MLYRFLTVLSVSTACLLADQITTPGVYVWDGPSEQQNAQFGVLSTDLDDGVTIQSATTHELASFNEFYEVARAFTVTTAGWFLETDNLQVNGDGSTMNPLTGNVDEQSPDNPFGVGETTWEASAGLGGSSIGPANENFFGEVDSNNTTYTPMFLDVGDYQIEQDFNLQTNLWENDLGAIFTTTLDPTTEPVPEPHWGGLLLLVCGVLFYSNRAICKPNPHHSVNPR